MRYFKINGMHFPPCGGCTQLPYNKIRFEDLMKSFIHLMKFCSISSPWAWVCRDSRCWKEERSLLAGNETAYSLAGCKLMCGESSMLWPKPRGSVYLSRKLASFARDQLKFIKVIGWSIIFIELKSFGGQCPSKQAGVTAYCLIRT